MSDGNDGQEPRSGWHHDSADGDAESLRKSSLPSVRGDGSPASSTITNQAVHSASASFAPERSASNGTVPVDLVSDGASEQALGFNSSAMSTKQRPRRWEANSSRGSSPFRPRSSKAIGKKTKSRSSPGRVATLPPFAAHDSNAPRGDRTPPSQLQSERFHLSPTSSDELSLTRSASPEEAALTQRSRESSEDISYGRESARQLSEEQSHVGIGTETTGEENRINDIRATYSGLEMCENSVIAYDKQLLAMDTLATHLQLQVITDLHWTLMKEHHDFFLACANPQASPSVKSLPETYMMPTRLWRHGIHDYLEMMRHHLPHSLEHMLSFIHLAYSMITTLLLEAPAYEETWMECLGDISRYRMATRTADMQESELWAGVAMTWYNRAADRNPDMGKFQHHLGVLARHDVTQKLFYYTKSLLVGQPYLDTETSVLDIFNPFLKDSKAMHRFPPISAFIAAHAFLFTGDVNDDVHDAVNTFLSHLDQYVVHLGETFILQGFFISACNLAAVLEYGNEDALLSLELDESNESKPVSVQDWIASAASRWTLPDDLEAVQNELLASRDSPDLSPTFFYGSYMAYQTMSVLLDRIGDKNIYAACHVYLAFLWCLALTPTGMKHMEAVIPWRKISEFLNSLFRSYIKPHIAERSEFPVSEETTWVAEDFLIRGQCWAQRFYPPSFFDGAPTVDYGRHVERPSRDITRMYRCLWLGIRLSGFNRWITYDSETRKFSTTRFALDLEEIAEKHNPFATQTSKGKQPSQRAKVP
ncbi:uncharacterized protein BO97DRAFT_422670 [Aspergillus homomorphus CBS 101889]|uniref:DNA/RNA-binding domain-containing protein n=1 Tax=Aspergillus homomorphus (strain CBS 101889) TaxID=1450537 RepID=A0A395I3F9_ASPHC|nr:hypothetical protein BO97DRAFT_422670 [Aspergillus homomorphus CBS 101889]RAL14239.1 hypothetical protein BO97DRAFT_422670 [Aspergillus homomorphus CBS 101889]